jgi:small conductance mechanosensitive channel
LKRNLDPSLGSFLGGLLGWSLKIMLLISVASMVGIATTSFVAVIGAAGLAIGLALQGSLSNFAGGVLILAFKPFKTGDFITAQGESGTVSKIDVFATTLTTADNKRVILPNGPLAGGKMINATAEETRRVELSVGIGYEDNIQKAIDALVKMCEEHPKVLKEPKVFVGVTGYGDSSINLTIRAWALTTDLWPVHFELNHKIKETLDKAQISIPFPQRDVHMIEK